MRVSCSHGTFQALDEQNKAVDECSNYVLTMIEYMILFGEALKQLTKIA
jgi:hypothetical protein